MRPHRLLDRFACRFVLALAALALAVPAGRVAAQDQTGDERMPVAGGTAPLLRQCGIRAQVEPARAMLIIVRAIHAPTQALDARRPSPEAVVAAIVDARKQSLPAEQVPALLPPGVWQNRVFGKSIPVEDLAAAIVGDRRASLLYYGLFSLDDETLAFFVAHPSLVSRMYRDHAAIFAAFAEGISVHGGRVVLPGDEGARPIWEDLVGEQAGQPEEFVPRLLDREDGRLAWMFDTIVHLDAPHRDFALARHVQDRGERLDEVKALRDVFADFERRVLSFPLRPFVRADVDPALVLDTVAVTPDGRLALPAELWAGVFPGLAGVAAPPVITAPRLLAQFSSRSARATLDRLLFAQRLLARSARPSPATPAMVTILSAFTRHQGLMLALERLRFSDPGDFARALETADAVTSGLDLLRAALRAAMFQGTLALLVRSHDVGTLDDASAQALCRELIALPVRQGYGEALAQWFESRLLPALSRGRAAGSTDAETRLIDGLAGAVPGRTLPVVRWEDQEYRVDLADGERRRLRQALERQRACPLTLALELRRLAAAADARSAASRLIPLVSGVDLLASGTLFGQPVASSRSAMLSDLRELERDPQDRGRQQAVRRRVADFLDVLMADILAAHVYAIAIEEPESTIWLVDPAWRAHDFDLVAPAAAGPWSLPASARARSSSVMRGSLIGLERTAAVFSLRRVSLDSPPVAPVISEYDVQGLAESAAAVDAFRLTDSSRDLIAGALKRGRERIASAARDRAALDTLARDAGIEGWRRRLMHWDADRDPAAVFKDLSLGELLALGCPNGLPAGVHDWGMSQRTSDGGFDPRLATPLGWHQMTGRRGAGLMTARVADLPLRVAELLAELGLPAALAHGVIQYATWDLITSVQMADIDDWFALMRSAQALGADQIADYVSALTADGPLVFVK